MNDSGSELREAPIARLLAEGDQAAAEKRYEAAESAYRMASVNAPTNARLALALGQTLVCLDRRDEALPWLERALSLEPNNVRALHEYAKLCLFADRAAAALYVAERLVLINGQDAAAHHAVGNALLRLGRVGEAEAAYRRALNIDPEMPLFRVALGILLLLRGVYAEGWALYESRFGMPEHSSLALDHEKNLWDGRPHPGLALVVHTEQGIGDIIQFARFLPRLRERTGPDARIILLCKPSLVNLMRELEGPDEVVPVGPGYHFKFNRQVSILSLGHYLNVDAAAIPAGVPYIKPSAGSRASFARRDNARLHVGLVWAARAENPTGYVRSCPMSALSGLFELQDVHFYSLQFGEEAAEIEPHLQRSNVTAIGGGLGPFEELLSAMQQLDLVITVDTAAAHLAGAAACPVWTLLPFAAEWRWGHSGDTTPWYPTMRLFRQRYPGDWNGLIELVRQNLGAYMPAPGQS